MQHCSGQNAIPYVQCCSAKQAHIKHCVSANTPMKGLLFIQVCKHQCSAALLGAKCNPHYSVLLCQTGPQHALCHCNLTYEGLPFIQVCSDPAPMQCSICSGQNAIPYVQCCSAKQAHSKQCVSANTPMNICSSYRCALTQHQCNAALLRAKCTPQYSVLLCQTGSQQALCVCKHSYEDLLFIQVCSDPAPMQCSTAQGKMQSPLLSAALPNRLAASTVYLQTLP